MHLLDLVPTAMGLLSPTPLLPWYTRLPVDLIIRSQPGTVFPLLMAHLAPWGPLWTGALTIRDFTMTTQSLMTTLLPWMWSDAGVNPSPLQHVTILLCATLATPSTNVSPSFQDAPKVKDLPFKPTPFLPPTKRPPTAKPQTTPSLIQPFLHSKGQPGSGPF